MSRPTAKSIVMRNEIVNNALKENPLITPSELKKLCLANGINTTITTMENMIADYRNNGKLNHDDTFKELLDTLHKLDEELLYNERLREHTKSDSAKAQFSRLCKEILLKKAEIATTIAQLRIQNREKTEVTYRINIGNFPEVQVKKEDVKDEE